MYDFRIGIKKVFEYVIECVGVVNFIVIEIWNIGLVKGLIRINFVGDWVVFIKDFVKIKFFKWSIFSVIRKCEELGFIEYILVDWKLRSFNVDLFNVLNGLGVFFFFMYWVKGSSNVYFIMDGSSGFVN